MINPFKAVGAFFAVKKGINKIKEEGMKTGWKTTEFWTTIVIPTVVSLFLQYQGMLPAAFVAKLVLVAGIAYGVLRTLLKAVAIIAPHTKTKVDDAIVSVGESVIGAIDTAVAPK